MTCFLFLHWIGGKVFIRFSYENECRANLAHTMFPHTSEFIPTKKASVLLCNISGTEAEPVVSDSSFGLKPKRHRFAKAKPIPLAVNTFRRYRIIITLVLYEKGGIDAT